MDTLVFICHDFERGLQSVADSEATYWKTTLLYLFL